MIYNQVALVAVVTLLLLTACGRPSDVEEPVPDITATSAPSNAPVTALKSTDLPAPTTAPAIQPTTQPPAEPASVVTDVEQQEPEPASILVPTSTPMPTTQPAIQPPEEPASVATAIPEAVIEPQAAEPSAAHTNAAEGVASYLSDVLHGAATASGAIYNKDEYVAAHKDLPFGTEVLVTNLHNGKSVTVTVIDRIPHNNPHLIDVSKIAAVELEMLDAGNVDARVEWDEK